MISRPTARGTAQTAIAPLRWITFAGNDFRRRKSFIDLSGKIRAEYQHHVSSEELDQPLVADPEVMRDLVEHDVPDLAA
jgi:hypothetical protein